MNNQSILYITDCLEILPQLKDNSVHLMYIDPPYNTGRTSFGYIDNQTQDVWDNLMSGVLNHLQRILTENGCLFISIDDGQYANLKLLCDNFFGAQNFLGTFITKQATRSNAKHINTIHEYVIAYAKNKTKCPEFKMKRLEGHQGNEINMLINKIKNEYDNLKHKQSKIENNEKYQLDIQNQLTKILNNEIKKMISENQDFNWLKNYNKVDENGEIYFATDLSMPNVGDTSVGYIIDEPEIGLYLNCYPLKNRHWVSKETVINLHLNNELAIINDRPYKKKYLKDSNDNAISLLNFHSRQGTADLRNDIGDLSKHFITPKPIQLINYLLSLTKHYWDRQGINPTVLDCFAGSGTTAIATHFVYPQSKWILIQNNEKCVMTNNDFQYISDICQLRLNNYKLDYRVVNS